MAKPTMHGPKISPSITVDGKTVQDFLNDQEDPDIKEEYRKAIAHPSRPTRDKMKTKQEYDDSPGPVKHLSAEEITMEAIKLSVKEQINEELKMSRPNRSKLLLGLLCTSKWITVQDATTYLNECLPQEKEITVQNVSSWFSALKHVRKPIGKFIMMMKAENGKYKYMLLPELHKASLYELHQLTLTTGTVTARDIKLKYPLVIPELRANREYMLQPDKMFEEKKPLPTPTITDIKARMPQELKEPPPKELTIPSTVTVKIKVEIPPIRILFGWDKQ